MTAEATHRPNLKHPEPWPDRSPLCLGSSYPGLRFHGLRLRPAFSGPDRDILAFCRAIDAKEDGSCKVGTATGYRILGIPVRTADIATAEAAAGIVRSVGVEIIKGHGLISVDQVRVYGS